MRRCVADRLPSDLCSIQQWKQIASPAFIGTGTARLSSASSLMGSRAAFSSAILRVGLPLAVAAGDEPQAAVFHRRVVERGQTGHRGVRVQLSVGVVLMPVERHGVAAHLEGEL